MNVLILNGSPRQNGNTAAMANAFAEGAMEAGHKVSIVPVAQKKISGCLACEYCHTKGKGACIQKDDMQEIYSLLQDADMLILASPIYYHGFSGQLKCAIDRFYSIAYPQKPAKLSKIAMFLSSGASDVYDGALYSYQGDFLNYLGLEDMGVYTDKRRPNKAASSLNEIRSFGRNLPV